MVLLATYVSPLSLNHHFAEIEWVEVLLEYAAPPIYCSVDGDAYGVYEIRSFDDMIR